MSHYAELHAISNFTFLRGASHPEELVEQAVALGYSGRSIAVVFMVLKLNRTSGSTNFLYFPISFASFALCSRSVSSVKVGGDEVSSVFAFFVSLPGLPVVRRVFRFGFPMSTILII